jgi:hypothetical protein
VQNLGGGNYRAAVNGAGGILADDEIQYERLYSWFYDLWYEDKAQLSFDLNFNMGTDYDYARIRYSVNYGASFQTLALWAEDMNERVAIDISDLTGFYVIFRFDFITYGGGASMTVDNMAIDDVETVPGWWSDKGDLVDYSLMTDLDLTGMETAILTLDTAWEIESYWDFGFVQVSTDGENWTSVANEFTTTDYDSSAMDTIVENVPGITGSSGGYVMSSYDLSEWAGQMVKVRLRYMTDWGTSLGGWYVKGAMLNGEMIDMEAWVSGNPAELNQWLVTLYFPGAVGLDSNVYMLPIMTTLTMDEVTQTVIRTLTSFTEYPEMYIIISPTSGNADYMFEFGNSEVMPPV